MTHRQRAALRTSSSSHAGGTSAASSARRSAAAASAAISGGATRSTPRNVAFGRRTVWYGVAAAISRPRRAWTRNAVCRRRPPARMPVLARGSVMRPSSAASWVTTSPYASSIGPAVARASSATARSSSAGEPDDRTSAAPPSAARTSRSHSARVKTTVWRTPSRVSWPTSRASTVAPSNGASAAHPSPAGAVAATTARSSGAALLAAGLVGALTGGAPLSLNPLVKAVGD